ncbi:hypothetical protein SY88_02545, partial [Clostridiales bacterium PH28_bin88]
MSRQEHAPGVDPAGGPAGKTGAVAPATPFKLLAATAGAGLIPADFVAQRFCAKRQQFPPVAFSIKGSAFSQYGSHFLDQFLQD